jgi:hypothetical protein
MMNQPTIMHTVRSGTRKGNERVELAKGPIRESNPGPPAPEAGIIPLDQLDATHANNFWFRNEYDSSCV